MSKNNNDLIKFGIELFVARNLISSALLNTSISKHTCNSLHSILDEIDTIRSDSEQLIDRQDGHISPLIFYPNSNPELGPVIMDNVETAIDKYIKAHPEYDKQVENVNE